MRRFVIAAALAAIAASPVPETLSTTQSQRIADSALVLNEIHRAPDNDVPQSLWDKASCVMIIPGLKKAAFVFGGEYGKGLMSCRRSGEWSAPVFMRLDKGSWGLQIGAQTIDLVFLVMNDRGVEKLLGNKVTLGAEMSLAAGPLGRDARAATDAQMRAEILSYSRTQGLFGGINVSGGVVRPDGDDNHDLYGARISPRDVLFGTSVSTPAAADPLMEALRRGM